MSASRAGIVLALMTCVIGVGTGAEPKPAELMCTEYCPVVYQLLRGGAADKLVVDGKERRLLAWGEANHSEGVWTHNGSAALILCGYLFPISGPVTDIRPDAPKAGDALECKVLVKSDQAGEKPVEDYEFTWHRYQDGQWAKADVPRGPKLAAGVTRDGERWTCVVIPKGAPAAYTGMGNRDEVVIGASRPGDSRANSEYGWAYGQWRHTRGYLKFDISSLAGKKVKSVKLRLFCDVQDPAALIQAYAAPATWKQKDITWANQPLPFPFADKPLTSVTVENSREPATPAQTGAQWSKWAPVWFELDLSDYVRRAIANEMKDISVCLACEAQTTKDHCRVRVYGPKTPPGYPKERGSVQPRLLVEAD